MTLGQKATADMKDPPMSSLGSWTWPIPDLGQWPDRPDRYHAIVIGAGIGGLTAAALLACRGYKVLVLEAHDRPGGCCSSWTRRVRRSDATQRYFVFDAGVQDISGLGPGGAVRSMLTELGAQNRLDWRRVRHRYILDGLCLDLSHDDAEFGTELRRLFPQEADGISALLEEIVAVYGEMRTAHSGGVPALPQTASEAMGWPSCHPRSARWLGVTFVEMLATYVSNPNLKRLLTTIAEYVTDDPQRLSVMEMVPLFGYYFDGGYYPAGGSQRFANLLRGVIEAHGGRVELRCTVSKIVIDRGRAAGVVCISRRQERLLRAPIVLSNGDLVCLTTLLDPALLPPRYLGRIRAINRGPSAVLVSLGLDRVPDLPARVFVSRNGLQFGIGNPSVIDGSLASPGCAAVTLLCVLPEAEKERWFGLERSAYSRAKVEIAERMLVAAASIIPNLRQQICYMQVAAPPTFSRYLRSAAGSIYGAARGQWTPPIKAPIPGLMLLGSGGQTGPGVEAVVIAGIGAANMIAPLGMPSGEAVSA
jgi:phytoene dehydrogenase-like protein